MRPIVIPFCALACLQIAATPSHEDELFTYATVAAVIQAVTTLCSDVVANPNGLPNLAATLHVGPADDMAVGLMTRQFVANFEKQAPEPPGGVRLWCDTVYDAFGPEGTKMRGVLRRAAPAM